MLIDIPDTTPYGQLAERLAAAGLRLRWRPERGRFIRHPAHDRRVCRGDDFSGDAWLDSRTGAIVHGAAGHDRNAANGEANRAGDGVTA